MVRVNFGGIVPFSTIDWRGKAALVIFLRGCPLRCIYCHNYNLLTDSHYVEHSEIEEEVKKNKEFIDAVVFSGGEPFMQPEALEALARVAKKHALLVAAQTNGFYPAVVESLLQANRIDKIFLDLKAPLSDATLYEKLTTVSGVTDRVKTTLAACLRANIELELVTTVFRHLVGSEEVKRIAHEIAEAGATDCPYVLQQGRAERVPSDTIKEAGVFSREELKELAASAYHAGDLKEVRIRTREAGEEVIVRKLGKEKW